MQHPKDVKGSDKSLLSIPVGQRYTTILGWLGAIEANTSNIEEDVEGLDRACNDRLDKIESEIRIMFKIESENHLAIMKIEKRIAVMQEKIDGID